MLLKVLKSLDWLLNAYASGIQPTIFTKLVNTTGLISKSAGKTLNIKAIESLGEQLEEFNFKKEAIDKVKAGNLGPTGATIVRGFLLTHIPLFIRISKYSKQLGTNGLEDNEIVLKIEEDFGPELVVFEENMSKLIKKLEY